METPLRSQIPRSSATAASREAASCSSVASARDPAGPDMDGSGTDRFAARSVSPSSSSPAGGPEAVDASSLKGFP